MSRYYVYAYELAHMKYAIVDILFTPMENRPCYNSISIECAMEPTTDYDLISKAEFEAVHGRIEYP